MCALSAIESVLTDLGVDTNLFFGKTRFSVTEMRITGYISFVGGLMLWYLPEKPNESIVLCYSGFVNL